MLEKELKKSMDSLSDSKKSMLDISTEMLEMTLEGFKAELEIIESQLVVEEVPSVVDSEVVSTATGVITEEARNELLDEKARIMAKMDLANKEYQEDKAELEDIGSDITISDSDKFASVLEVISKIDRDCETDITDTKRIHYTAIKKLLQETLSSVKLTTFNPCMNKTKLRQEYVNITRDLQRRLGKDNRFVYPSCFQLKASIKDMIISAYPEMEEKELNKKCKSFTAFIALHLCKIDIKTEGIYIYYVMQNIYKMESLPIDEQFKFKKTLLDILEGKLY